MCWMQVLTSMLTAAQERAVAAVADALPAAVEKLATARSSPLIVALLGVFAQLVHTDAAQLIDYLAAAPAPGNPQPRCPKHIPRFCAAHRCTAKRKELLPQIDCGHARLRNFYHLDAWLRGMERRLEAFRDTVWRAGGQGSALDLLLQVWTERALEFKGAAEIKLSTTALAGLLAARHPALSSVQVKGRRLDVDSGIRTRARAAHQAEQWQWVPAPAKLLALLADALIELREGPSHASENSLSPHSTTLVDLQLAVALRWHMYEGLCTCSRPPDWTLQSGAVCNPLLECLRIMTPLLSCPSPNV